MRSRRRGSGTTHFTEPSNDEAAMAQATIQNQKKLMAGQRAITGNQIKIIRNQQAILKNQKKILSNQSKILRK